MLHVLLFPHEAMRVRGKSGTAGFGVQATAAGPATGGGSPRMPRKVAPHMTRGPYKSKPIPGSWAALIRDFRTSPRYRNWSPGSEKNAERFFGDLLANIGRDQVSSCTLADITLWRDSMSEYPAAANSF